MEASRRVRPDATLEVRPPGRAPQYRTAWPTGLRRLYQAGLSDRDIARATGVAARPARAWLAGTQHPTGAGARRLDELAVRVERIARAIDASFIAVWLREPIPALNYDRLLDVIERGDYRTVAGLVSALEESTTT